LNEEKQIDPSEVATDGQESSAVDGHFADSMEAAEVEAGHLNPAEELAQVKTELDEARKRTLLSQAELENFRKRIRRDAEQERKYAAMPLLRGLLPVIDNLQLALGADSADHGTSGVIDGVRMVSGQLISVLKDHHCEVIEAAGMAFDPEVHEAIEHRQTNEMEAGTIIEVRQTGYRLHDRVVRPARVVVARACEETLADQGPSSDVVENEA